MARIPLIRPFRAGKVGLQRAYKNFIRNRALDRKLNIKSMSDAQLARYIKQQQAINLRRTNKLAPWKIGGGIAAALGATGIASLALPNLLNTLKITNTVNNDPNFKENVTNAVSDAISQAVSKAVSPVQEKVIVPAQRIYERIRQDAYKTVPYAEQKAKDVYRQGKQDVGKAYQRINQDAGSVYSQGRRDVRDAYQRITRDGTAIYNKGSIDAQRVYDRTTGDVRNAYDKATRDVEGGYNKVNKDIDNRLKYGQRKVQDFMNRTRDIMQRGKTIFQILSQPYQPPAQYDYPQY